MDHYLDYILYNYSYFELFWLSFAYFIFLYFGIGSLFLYICKRLEAKKILHKIEQKEIPRDQITHEIKQSIISIIVFGFSIMPIIYLVRVNVIQLLPNTWFNILLGIIILNLWNELHFYIVHRMMHQKFMMKHVHFIHHKSYIPTVYSVYSFHWLEAFLLSTVPLSIVPFIPFSIIAVFVYPFTSILLNFAGHCNYRFGNGQGNSWILFATTHNQHHSKGRKNFGFVLNFFDSRFNNRTPHI